MTDRVTILTGDCRDTLRTLESGSVHCCVTSPPYYGLRDYGTGEWSGGNEACDHVVGEYRRGLGLATSVASTRGGGHKAATVEPPKARGLCPKCGAIRVDKQIGQEASPEDYVETLVQVFREVRRVLRDDGTLWLNLGDSYANDTKWGGKPSGKHAKALHADGSIGRCRHLTGLAGKNLMGIPWRVAFALQADGWILRSEIVWYKPNPMPESTTDRPTKSHEKMFLFSKSSRYYYDQEAIKEPVADSQIGRVRVERGQHSAGSVYVAGVEDVEQSPDLFGEEHEERRPGVRPSLPRGSFNGKTESLPGRNAFRAVTETRNKRDVWEVPEELMSQFLQWLDEQPAGSRADVWKVATLPFPGAHFATFPPDLIKPCILAGCPPSGTHCDCDEIISTPTGDGEIDDPSLVVGRAGMSRPRRANGGTRAITRRQQRSDAAQMKQSIHRETMEKLCGYQAFEHYVRTDPTGARPLPADLRNEFIAQGWIAEAGPCECAIRPAGVTLDPFGGSGTTGMVAVELGRRAILCELNPQYVPLIHRRCDTTPGFDFTPPPQIALSP